MTFLTKITLACALGIIAGRIRVRGRMARMAAGNGGDPTPEPEETTIPIDFSELDSQQRAEFDWRFGQLRAAGFDELRATTLALRRDGSWRRAIEHVNRGADPVVAANIEL